MTALIAFTRDLSRCPGAPAATPELSQPGRMVAPMEGRPGPTWMGTPLWGISRRLRGVSEAPTSSFTPVGARFSTRRSTPPRLRAASPRRARATALSTSMAARIAQVGMSVMSCRDL